MRKLEVCPYQSAPVKNGSGPIITWLLPELMRACRCFILSVCKYATPTGRVTLSKMSGDKTCTTHYFLIGLCFVYRHDSGDDIHVDCVLWYTHTYIYIHALRTHTASRQISNATCNTHTYTRGVNNPEIYTLRILLCRGGQRVEETKDNGGHRVVALEGRTFGRLGKLAIVERCHLSKSRINKV